MSAARRPTSRQIRRQRRIAALLALVGALGAVYLVLELTVLAPVDTHGARVTNLTIHSAAVGRDLDVGVVLPPEAGDGARRPLLVFLHGKSEAVATYTEDKAFFAALAKLGARAPVVAFPEDDGDSYWHDRASGNWGRYVLDEVIPQVSRRFDASPRRVAIGGVSMGGFGAYDLALRDPGRFCAVGGHSPALWLAAEDAAPGAFDSAEDFEANDVISTLRRYPGAFGPISIWNDYGSEDPFAISDIALDKTLEGAGADLSAHGWPGGHERSYWDQHWGAYLHFYADALARCR